LSSSALAQLERYLHEEIPISRAMGVGVAASGPDGVHLSMPLAPNLNHRGGLFGGSGAALAILAGWTLVHERLQGEAGLDPHIVIQRCQMEYLAPITSDVTAHASPPPPEAWERFIRTFRRRGRARLQVVVELAAGGKPEARLVATFAALERLEDEGSEG
jgi:thioesterase domain-containing protein